MFCNFYEYPQIYSYYIIIIIIIYIFIFNFILQELDHMDHLNHIWEDNAEIELL